MRASPRPRGRGAARRAQHQALVAVLHEGLEAARDARARARRRRSRRLDADPAVLDPRGLEQVLDLLEQAVRVGPDALGVAVLGRPVVRRDSSRPDSPRMIDSGVLSSWPAFATSSPRRASPSRVRCGAERLLAARKARETGVVRVHQARHVAILRRSSVRGRARLPDRGLAGLRAGGQDPSNFTSGVGNSPRTRLQTRQNSG